LWTETFDREYSAEQLFAIQSDVAGQVALALHASLSADERRRIDELPTTNTDAYAAYLEGLKFLRAGRQEEHFIGARRNFERAVELDPSFALAYAGLSRAARNHHWFANGRREALEEARRAAECAIEIASDLSEAHLALGTLYYLDRDYDAALKHLSRAERGLPGNSELMRWKAFIIRRRGGWEDALRDLERARSLNPRDAQATMEVAFTLFNLRRYDEAEEYFGRALELAPQDAGARIYGSLVPLMRDGSVASAIAAAEGIELAENVPWKYIHSWQALLAAGDFEGAAASVSKVERIQGQWHDYPNSVLLGWTYLLQDRAADAREQFEKAVRILEDDVAEDPKEGKLYASLGVAYAGLGRFEEAIEAGRRATELWPIEKDTFVGTWMLQDLGWIYVMAGEHDAAVEAFDRILAVPSVWSIEMLKADPRAAPLNGHPAFQALVTEYSRPADV
jgi:tetratricopeptide (TPR) repeat protein